jgi:hypothetical protein
MTAAADGIQWWSRLRTRQRERIKELERDCHCDMARLWLAEARLSFDAVNVQDVERCLRMAAWWQSWSWEQARERDRERDRERRKPGRLPIIETVST